MRIKFFLSLSLILGFSISLFSQSEVSTVEKAEALFIYNFSRHIGWPESSFANNEFVIGVVGNKDLFNELSKITKDKMVGRFAIVVKQFNSADELLDSHMLIFGNRVRGGIDAYRTKIGSFPSLFIDTSDGASNAIAGISFKLIDQKMNYTVSRNNIKNKGLTMSKRLEEMAYNVN